MKPSKHDGKHILYVDPARLQHSGEIIGQSDDEEWLLVKSDRFQNSKEGWHFRVKPEMLPGMVVRNSK